MTGVDVVLYEPARGANLGSVCRALKTLALPPPLLLDAPEGLERSPEAVRLAHGSKDALEAVRRLTSVEELFSAYDFVIGTTNAHRRSVGESVGLRELPGLLERKGSSIRRAALLFGSEARGVPSELLARCDLVSTIPLAIDYPSLNLAQAVLLYAYELSPIAGGTGSPRAPGTADSGDAAETVISPSHRALRERLEAELERAGANGALIGRILERLALLCESDVALAHSALTALTE